MATTVFECFARLVALSFSAFFVAAGWLKTPIGNTGPLAPGAGTAAPKNLD